MTTENQQGWKFEPFEDEVGYYTFRFGGPVYGTVEPDSDTSWRAFICWEESDVPIVETASRATLEDAKAGIVPGISSLLETWRGQFMEVAQIPG